MAPYAQFSQLTAAIRCCSLPRLGFDLLFFKAAKNSEDYRRPSSELVVEASPRQMRFLQMEIAVVEFCHEFALGN
jgi:hypothetical protein